MRVSLFAAATLAAAALVFASPVSEAATLDACGGIHLSAGAQCEVVPPGASCTAQCTPITVEVSCAAQLQVECSGECTGSASVECSGSCQGSCEAECDVDPGSFDCATYCEADCSSDCAATCSDSQCNATCEANCSATCGTECEVVPASANCQAECNGCCSGSCTAESTLDCQASCSSNGYAECTTEVQGGCETDCSATEGALFCDGHYVNADSLLACVTALKDALDVEVSGYADLECAGGTCKAEAGVGCSVGNSQSSNLGVFGLLLMAMVASSRRKFGVSYTPKS